MVDKHFFEQIFRKVEHESFFYDFRNSGDLLYQETVKVIFLIFSTFSNSAIKGNNKCHCTFNIDNMITKMILYVLNS